MLVKRSLRAKLPVGFEVKVHIVLKSFTAITLWEKFVSTSFFKEN